MRRVFQRLDSWPFWQARTLRERMLLLVLAAVAVMALFLVAVVRPLQATRSAARADIRTYQGLALRLRGTMIAPAPPGLQRTGDAGSIVAAASAEAGLLPEAVTPEGSKVRVAFADAGYDAVLRWVVALERTSRFRVEQLTVTSGTTTGRVRAEAVVG